MITNLFSTPIISEELNLDLDILTDYTMSMQEFSPAGIKRSNLGGWHSDLLKEENISNEEMKKLLNETLNSLNKYKEELNIRKRLNPIIVSTWININRKGNINRNHVHPDSHFSATFYVKTKSIGELGCLEVLHPARNVIDFCWADILETQNTTTASRLEIAPKPNDLYIIPAWLEHAVLPHGNDEFRISITINMSFV